MQSDSNLADSNMAAQVQFGSTSNLAGSRDISNLAKSPIWRGGVNLATIPNLKKSPIWRGASNLARNPNLARSPIWRGSCNLASNPNLARGPAFYLQSKAAGGFRTIALLQEP